MTIIGIFFTENHCLAAKITNKTTLTCIQAKQITIEELKTWVSKSTRVIVSVAFHQVIMREFTLDASLSDKEIITFLKSKSESLFEHAEHDLRFDYEIISRDSEHKTISAIIAHEKEIQTVEKLFLQNKIKLHAIDVDIFALARLTQHSSKKHALLHYYHDRILIVIASAGKLIGAEYAELSSHHLSFEKANRECDFVTFLGQPIHDDLINLASNKVISFESLLKLHCINATSFSYDALSCFAIPIGLCLWGNI